MCSRTLDCVRHLPSCLQDIGSTGANQCVTRRRQGLDEYYLWVIIGEGSPGRGLLHASVWSQYDGHADYNGNAHCHGRFVRCGDTNIQLPRSRLKRLWEMSFSTGSVMMV